MIDPLEERDAQLTVRDMVCSICGGSLVEHFVKGRGRLSLVLCRSCEKDTMGYISRAVYARRKAQAMADMAEVKRFYSDEKNESDEDEINKQLGF